MVHDPDARGSRVAWSTFVDSPIKPYESHWAANSEMPGHFVYDLGCLAAVSEVRLRNSHTKPTLKSTKWGSHLEEVFFSYYDTILFYVAEDRKIFKSTCPKNLPMDHGR